MDFERIALIITRLYGATFLALGAGWFLMALSASAMKAASLGAMAPRFTESASGYFTQTCVYLVAGIAIVSLSRRIARFAIRP